MPGLTDWNSRSPPCRPVGSSCRLPRQTPLAQGPTIRRHELCGRSRDNKNRSRIVASRECTSSVLPARFILGRIGYNKSEAHEELQEGRPLPASFRSLCAVGLAVALLGPAYGQNGPIQIAGTRGYDVLLLVDQVQKELKLSETDRTNVVDIAREVRQKHQAE